MSQELEQAVKSAAMNICHHLNDNDEQEAWEHLVRSAVSPLFTRLSQRITEWEERWSKDASQSESECRARDRRIEELEAQAGARLTAIVEAMRHLHGGRYTEVFDVLDRERLCSDAGKSLLAELVELREKWERAKGVLERCARNCPNCRGGEQVPEWTGTSWRGINCEACQPIRSLLSSSPGQAADAGWVSVLDRLPDDGRIYLWGTCGMPVALGNGGIEWATEHGYTHWLEIPYPPAADAETKGGE